MQINTKYPITREEVVPTAERMRQEGRLLIMIHGHLDKEGQPVVCYEYDAGPEVLSYEVRGERSLPSIAPVYDAAAAWPEREINELLGFTFEGLDTSQRLFLPDNLLEGQGQIMVTPIHELRGKNGLE